MIKSMTGFGRAQQTVDNMEIVAEIRAVNHRHFEFSSRIMRQYSFLEDKIKSYVSTRVARGKTEVSISINMLEGEASEISVNVPLATAYAKALRNIAAICGTSDEFSAVDIARFPDVLTVNKAEQDEQRITEAVISVVAAAVDSFIEMRTAEGEKLKEDVLNCGKAILGYVDFIESHSEETVKAYRQRIEEKMRELLDDKQIDEQRLLTETAIFADKVAVDEETVRLRSHISQLEKMLESDESIGRKLDFLVQEMNREANTIGSKCCNLEITEAVLNIKAQIEKIREQIQNIE